MKRTHEHLYPEEHEELPNCFMSPLSSMKKKKASLAWPETLVQREQVLLISVTRTQTLLSFLTSVSFLTLEIGCMEDIDEHIPYGP